MDSNQRRIRLKCRYEGEIRTVTVTSQTDILELKRRLSTDYGFDVALKYEDKDGDFILLASQNDFDDLILCSETDTINAIVSEAITLPNLHLKGGYNNKINNGLSSSTNSGFVSIYNTTTSSNIWPTANNNTKLSNAPSIASQSLSKPIIQVNNRLDRFPNILTENSGKQHEAFNIRWKKGEMLGQGAFGVVFLGLNIDTGELMAVKQMATEEVSKRELSSLENEIKLLRNLRHPNIVRYIGTELDVESMSIFLEYVPGGSLKALIDKFGHLEESVAKSYTRQLLIGLEYLHRNGIAHRDIKGANCLVGNDGVIKLADFGNSKHWRTTVSSGNGLSGGVQIPPTVQTSSGDIKGTPSWMAPEVIRDEGGSISWRKADIWSLGCTTLEMATGKAPWAQFDNPVTILYHIACQETLPEYPHPASLELVTFLNTCLQRDPQLRPDITSLLLHPFVCFHPSTLAINSGSTWGTSGTSSALYNSISGAFTNRPTTVSSSMLGSAWHKGSSRNIFDNKNDINTNSSVRVQRPSRSESDNIETPRVVLPPDIAIISNEYNQTNDFNISNSPENNSSILKDFQSRHHDTINTNEFDPELAHEIDNSTNTNNGMIEQNETSSSSISKINGGESITNGFPFPQKQQYLPNNKLLSVHSKSTSKANKKGGSSKASNNTSRHQQLQNTQNVSSSPKLLNRKNIDNSQKQSVYHSSIYNSTTQLDELLDDSDMITNSKSRSNLQSSNTDTYLIPLNDHQSSKFVGNTTIITNGSIAAGYNDDSDDLWLRKDTDLESTIGREIDSDRDDNDTIISATSLLGYSSAEAGLLDEFIHPNYNKTDNVNNILNYSSIENRLLDSPDLNSFPNNIDHELRNSSRSNHRKSFDKNQETLSLEHSLSQKELELSVLTGLTPHLSNKITTSTPANEFTQIEVSNNYRNPKQDGFRNDKINIISGKYNKMDKDNEGSLDMVENLDMSITGMSTRIINGSSAKSYLTRRSIDGTSAQGSRIRSGKKTPGSNSSTNRNNKDKVEIVDPLDISCDSLDKLQVTGTSKYNTDRGDMSQQLLSSQSSKVTPMTRQSRRISGSVHTAHGTRNKGDESHIDDRNVEQSGKEKQHKLWTIAPVALEEHTGAVTRLRIPARSNLLLSASVDGTIRIWGPDSDRSRAVLEVNGFKSEQMQGTYFDSRPERRITLGTSNNNADSDLSIPTSNTIKAVNMWSSESCDSIWAACSDAALRVWSGVEGRPLRLMKGHEDVITCMEGMDSSNSNNSNNTTMNGGNISSVVGNILNGVSNGQNIGMFSNNTANSTNVGIGSCLVATGSVDRTVRIWDARAKKSQVFLFRGHGDTVLAMRWGEGGRSLVSAGKDKTVRIWDTRAGRLRITLEKHFGSVNSLRILPITTNPTSVNNGFPGLVVSNKADIDGVASIISAGRDSMINVWSNNGDCISSQAAHRGSVSFLSDVNFNKLMISLGTDNMIKIWDMKRIKCISEIFPNNSTSSSSVINSNNSMQSPSLQGTFLKAVWCGQSFVTASTTGLVRMYEYGGNNNELSSCNNDNNPITTTTTTNYNNNSIQPPLSDWIGRDLAVHGSIPQPQSACTDLICSMNANNSLNTIASASRSGQILRWNW